jgi:hypothetical protein
MEEAAGTTELLFMLFGAMPQKVAVRAAAAAAAVEGRGIIKGHGRRKGNTE